MIQFKLRVEQGAEVGRIDEIPATGAAIGRSKNNDISYSDELQSRQHCRVYFKGSELYIMDLVTMNGTFVNGRQITDECRLYPGDVVRIGGTYFMVSLPDGSFPEKNAYTDKTSGFSAPAADSTTSASVSNSSSESALNKIDLGLRPSVAKTGADGNKRKEQSSIVNVILVCVVVVLVAAAIKFMTASPDSPAEVVALPQELPLSFSYVKVKATQKNIQRYQIELDESGRLSAIIDSVADNRHFAKKSAEPIPQERQRELERKFSRAGLFELSQRYEGRARAGEWNTSRLSARFGGKVLTVDVRNHIVPSSLAAIVDEIETFANNELELWSFAHSKEELLEQAEESFAQGNTHYAERDIKPENLFRAARSYASTIAHLETFDPKPELYDEARECYEKADAELNRRIDDLNWRADLATNTKDWNAAREALQEILEYIPDRSDKRNKEAEVRLMDVEKRLRK